MEIETCDQKQLFYVEGMIDVDPAAPKGFGSHRLIERLKHAGIDAEQDELLVPVRVRIPDDINNPDYEENCIDWTQKTPPFIAEKIKQTAVRQWQQEQKSLGDASQKHSPFEMRKKAIKKDTDSKMEKLVFPPALPLCMLENEKHIAFHGFDDCINYRLKINPESHQGIQSLRTADETIALLSIPTQPTQRKIIELQSLFLRRSNDDDVELNNRIDELETNIALDAMFDMGKTTRQLEKDGIVAKKNANEEDVMCESNSSLIVYTNSCFHPGPNAKKMNGRQVALEHHGVKRPFDLFQNGQTNYGSQSKKRRIGL